MGKPVLYALTFTGLYLELAGAFLLSAEAIGSDNLLKVAATMRRHRIFSFMVLAAAVAGVLVLSRLKIVIHLTEAIILILSIGLFYDFGPRVIEILVSRLKKGTAGIAGFILFAVGFAIQAYVTLSLLY